jgi:type IV pilus assembly protein PilV
MLGVFRPDSLAPKASQGFTLLEVLVALVVLSIGLLGLAGLQATSLRNNTSAYQRSIATMQAYDIADRMRANLPAVKSGAYVINGIPAGAVTCNPCTSTQIATIDAQEWNGANAALLAGGAGTVAQGGNIFTVTISWSDDRNTQNPQTTTFTTSFQP